MAWLPCLIFATFLAFCQAWLVSESGNNCGEIYFEPKFQGNFLQLKNTEQVADLSYVATKLSHQNQSHSFKLQSGCHLVTSDKKYLKGTQYLFENDINDLPTSEYNPKSVFCSCPKVSITYLEINASKKLYA